MLVVFSFFFPHHGSYQFRLSRAPMFVATCRCQIFRSFQCSWMDKQHWRIFCDYSPLRISPLTHTIEFLVTPSRDVVRLCPFGEIFSAAVTYPWTPTVRCLLVRELAVALKLNTETPKIERSSTSLRNTMWPKKQKKITRELKQETKNRPFDSLAPQQDCLTLQFLNRFTYELSLIEIT
jgi:hypothetical protein